MCVIRRVMRLSPHVHAGTVYMGSVTSKAAIARHPKMGVAPPKEKRGKSVSVERAWCDVSAHPPGTDKRRKVPTEKEPKER